MWIHELIQFFKLNFHYELGNLVVTVRTEEIKNILVLLNDYYILVWPIVTHTHTYLVTRGPWTAVRK